jgi:murein DD-endopeptidase MepM/ murein hydrolase activator NlpD
MADQTETLLAELQKLDDREDLILGVLLRHGAALEEAQRRMNMVSIADLRPLRDGLATLEATIDKLQADVARAEAASTPPQPSAPAAVDPSNGHDAPVDAPETTSNDMLATSVATGPGAPTDPAAAPTDAGAPAPVPLATMTFAELAARIRDQEKQESQIKEILRARLLALGARPAGPDAGALVPEIDDALAVPIPATPSLPVPVVPRTFKLRESPMKGTDVEAFQHNLNFRFKAWGIMLRVAQDGVYDKQTRRAARRVLLGLGVDLEDAKGGITPQLQRLIHKPSLRTPDQLKRAEANRPWLRRLKARAAGTKPKPHGAATGHGTAKPVEKPAVAPAGSVQAAIRKHGGRYENIIVREAKRHNLPISLVCAVLEKESNFTNVFGHDRVRNPVKSPPNGVLRVTEARYKRYLKHRNEGQGCQGVGPMQLTNRDVQNRADNLGGCWKEHHNIRAGCELLADNIKRLASTRRGVRAYNGNTDAATDYATDVLKKQAVWHSRLKGKPSAHPGTPAPHEPLKPAPHKPLKPKRPRTFKVQGHMHGKDIRGWQRTLRRQFRTWGVDYPLAVDGRYGPITRSATSDVLKGLGIPQEMMRQGVTPQLRIKVRHKALTPAERARCKARLQWRRRLRKKYTQKGVAPPLNRILSSSWGYHPGAHDGVDLICRPNAPIMALCDAEVIDVRSGGWWGLGAPSNPGVRAKGDGIIQLRCLTDVGPFKRGMHFGYGHAEQASVRVGQKVRAGEVIGKAGLANAWHVHFMANRGGPVRGVGDRDPMPYVNYAVKRGRR